MFLGSGLSQVDKKQVSELVTKDSSRTFQVSMTFSNVFKDLSDLYNVEHLKSGYSDF